MNVYFFTQLTKKKKRKEKVPGEKATCEARGLGLGAACWAVSSGPWKRRPKRFPKTDAGFAGPRDAAPRPAVGRGSSQPAGRS